MRLRMRWRWQPEASDSGRAMPRVIVAAALAALGLAVLAMAVNVYAIFTSGVTVTPNDFASDTLDTAAGLTATGTGPINLSWTATVDTYASGHRVFRSTSAGGPYTQITEVTPRTTTTYTDNPAAGTYYYVLRAFDGNWESANGNEASATDTGGGAGIAFDAASVATAETATLTWSHTVGAGGVNRIIIVGVSAALEGGVVTGVTYAGQPLTQIGGQTDIDGITRVELWYKVAPPTGANDVVVSLSVSAGVVGGATSWTGVDQTTPLGTAAFTSSESSLATVDVSSAVGEVVVDVVSTEAAAVTVGPGQAQRWNLFPGTVVGGGSSEPGAAPTVTMSWTSTTAFWAIGGVSMKPAP